MRSHSILVHGVRTPASLQLQDALCTGGDEVMCLESEHLACNVIEARAVDLIAVDADGGVPLDVLRAAAHARVPLVSVSARTEVAVHLLRECGAANLVVCPGGEPQYLDVDVADLVATKQKLLSDGPFGVHHYVAEPSVRYAIDSVAQSHYMAICIRDDLRARGRDRKRAARLALLAHQLATSALECQFDGDDVHIDVASDRLTLAVSIRFGGLDANELEALVRACVDDDVRPAGSSDFGLPSVLTWCRTVVINAVPDQATEIIGLIPNELGGARAGLASLHLSITEPLTPTPLMESAPLETIDLSDSMRQQLRESAACGGFGAVDEIIPETSGRIRVPHARTRSERPLDLRYILEAITTAPSEDRAVKAALEYVRERFIGGVAFEVDLRSVSVWAAVGVVADVVGLRQFIVDVHEASTLAFLAREAALLQGRPGRSSGSDRRLAKLVTGHEGAYSLSISVAVGGRVRYILYGCEPAIDRAQVERELQIVAEMLSRALRRIDRDVEYVRQHG